MTLPMSDLSRALAAAAWRGASGPLRAWRRRRDAARGELPIPAVFYHRVADERPTPWTMNCADFAAQIDWMAKRFEFVSLAEIQRRMDARDSVRPAVAITFDDGYRENLDFALPLLLRRRIPVAYFVTAGNVLTGEPFPHDRERGLAFPPHTASEIADLDRDGVEIGVHTMTHRDLGQDFSDAELHEEIVGARETLEGIIGRRLNYFAFPFGQRANISAAALAKVRTAGYAGWCSAFGGYNVPGRASDHLLRFHGDPSLPRMANWLTGDPRWRNVGRDLEPIRKASEQLGAGRPTSSGATGSASAIEGSFIQLTSTAASRRANEESGTGKASGTPEEILPSKLLEESR